MSKDGNRLVIYTDGGAYNTGSEENKGVGSWAYVQVYDNNIVEVHAKFVPPDTTNNRTEMLAVINAIKNMPIGSHIEIISDSGYVVTGYNHPSYLDRWKLNGWKTSTNKPVLNRELWEELSALCYQYGVKFTLIKGHHKDPNPTHSYWNSVVDTACSFIMDNYRIDDEVIIGFNKQTSTLVYMHSVNDYSTVVPLNVKVKVR